MPRSNRLAQRLLSKEGAQPFGTRRAPLPDASERNRGGFAGVLPLVRLVVRTHGLDPQTPAAILSHVRHDAKTTANLKHITRVDPREGNDSAHGRQARAQVAAATNGTF
jgi:hypothetical protein